jgi:hypothetical protein
LLRAIAALSRSKDAAPDEIGQMGVDRPPRGPAQPLLKAEIELFVLRRIVVGRALLFDYSFCPDNLQLMTYLAALCPNVGLGTAAVIVPWHDASVQAKRRVSALGRRQPGASVALRSRRRRFAVAQRPQGDDLRLTTTRNPGNVVLEYVRANPDRIMMQHS